jgi:hypothetical protein
MPPSPSFTPAAGAGTPGAGSPGAGMPRATGSGAGTGNGWDDSGSAQALPARQANGDGGTTPDDGAPDDGADQTIPRLPAASVGPGGPDPGPSRLPAFGGQVPQAPKIPQSPIGGQDVRGGDGSGARGPAAASVQGSDVPDSKTEPGKVMVPPPATPDQRLPIYDSLESDWFRRSGKTVSTARPSAGTQVGQTAAQSSWTSPADEGWRAAQALAAPSAADTTQAGLPKRVPRANLVPGSVGGGGGGAEAEAPARSPDAARTRMASFQRGVREGRAAAPQTEEP